MSYVARDTAQKEILHRLEQNAKKPTTKKHRAVPAQSIHCSALECGEHQAQGVNYIKRIDKNVRIITGIVITFAIVTVLSAIFSIVSILKLNEIMQALASAIMGA